MTVELLIQNWNDYDRRKVAQHKDADRFDYTATWEVAYLTNVIKSTYSFIPEDLIREAIQICGERQTAPSTRATFTEAVLKRLSIPL
jgi:hypothetical protein